MERDSLCHRRPHPAQACLNLICKNEVYHIGMLSYTKLDNVCSRRACMDHFCAL